MISQVLYPTARIFPAAAQLNIVCWYKMYHLVFYTNFSCATVRLDLNEHAVSSLVYCLRVRKGIFFNVFIGVYMEASSLEQPVCGLIWPLITHFTWIVSDCCQVHTGLLGPTGLRYC